MQGGFKKWRGVSKSGEGDQNVEGVSNIISK